MRQTRRRSWLVVALAAVLAVAAVHVVVKRRAHQPPNYSLIEDGFSLGGQVSEPPPGTLAVLNLCERKDIYRAEVHVASVRVYSYDVGTGGRQSEHVRQFRITECEHEHGCAVGFGKRDWQFFADGDEGGMSLVGIDQVERIDFQQAAPA